MIPNLGVDNVTNLLALWLVETSKEQFSLEEILSLWEMLISCMAHLLSCLSSGATLIS